MQKINYILLFFSLWVCNFAFGQNQKLPGNTDENNYCKSHDLTQELLENNPEFYPASEPEFEAFLAKNGTDQLMKNGNCNRVITVPVVIHYIYDGSNLNDGYDDDNYVLNTVMAGLNSYFTQDQSIDDNLPPAFQGTAADGTCIEWCLAQYDHPTNANLHGNDIDRDGVKDANNDGRLDEGQYAINRYSVSGTQINNIRNAGPGANQQNLIQNVAPAWPVNEYLNMYVLPDLLNTSGGTTTAGYTYLPNNGSADYNSIYIGYDFATAGTTIAHECGHWLGLNHVWQNSSSSGCGAEDYFLSNTNYPITQTYDQAASSISVGGGTCNATTDGQVPQSCGSVDNIFNIMDYGGCTRYFVIDQASYMFAALQSLTAGGRNNFNNDLNLIKCQAPNPPVAAFSPNSGTLNLCLGEAINFTDNSTNSPTSWNWSFSGSALNSNQTSTQQNPSIVPDQAGTITISLTVSNANGSDSAGPSTVTINILPNGSTGCPPINNECFGAIDISSAFPACPNALTVLGTYDNSDATSEPSDLALTGYLNNLTSSTGTCCLCEDENNSDTNEIHNSLWFTFTPSQSGNYLIEAIAQSSSNGCGGTLGSSEDTQMLIYESGDGTCNSLSFFDCNEDGPSASTGLYPAGGTFALNAGTTYYLIVDEYYFNGLETGTFCLEVEFQDPCSNTGCTDPCSPNYDSTAVTDDGSCQPQQLGCTDPAACNYDNTALCDDSSCLLPDGCTDPTACNFDNTAQCDDSSCAYDPDANFTTLNATYCTNDASITLVPNTNGGSFSGPGVSGNTFDPANVPSSMWGASITITYTVTVNGCTNSENQQTIVDACVTPGLKLDVTVCLEGAYDPASNSMRTDLRQQNLIPLSQPYNVAPWNYAGTESVANASIFPANMVDWVVVEMRSGTPSTTGSSPTTTLIESHAGFLLDDGSVVDLDGVSPLTFDLLSSGLSYHILVRHRNHLNILSNNPIPATTNMAYDFTFSMLNAFGSQQLKLVGPSTYAMYAADFTTDGVIQITDFNQWIVYPAVLNVYDLNDANMDGTVQTTDFDMWYDNKAKISPVEVTP